MTKAKNYQKEQEQVEKDGAAGAAQAPKTQDEHHGKGGLYQLIDGQRTLVAQTQEKI